MTQRPPDGYPRRPRRIYIAGPMRGYEQFNFPAFDEAAALWRQDGWEVFSPADHDRETGFDPTKDSLDGFDMNAAWRWDACQIAKSQAIALLPGWEGSMGVTMLELPLALALELVPYDALPPRYRLDEGDLRKKLGNRDFSHLPSNDAPGELVS